MRVEMLARVMAEMEDEDQCELGWWWIARL